MNSIKIPFLQELDLNIPAIRVSFSKDKEILALVDSGADTTVFDIKSLPKNALKKAEAKQGSYVGMNGEVTPSNINKVELPCLLNGTELQIAGITAYLDYLDASMGKYNTTGLKLGMLLGSNSLDKYKAKIDYENKVVEFYYD